METYHEEETFSLPVRRRKRQRPKWQRILLKYWPPIRFGLLILNLIAFLVFLVSFFIV